MTKNDIMTRICHHAAWRDDLESLIEFVEQIIKEEREACALLCEEVVIHPPGYGGQWEAYGPVKTQRDGKECAAAIRARSNASIE